MSCVRENVYIIERENVCEKETITVRQRVFKRGKEIMCTRWREWVGLCVRDNGCKCMQESEYVRFVQKEKGHSDVKGRKERGEENGEREGEKKKEREKIRKIQETLVMSLKISEKQSDRQAD